MRFYQSALLVLLTVSSFSVSSFAESEPCRPLKLVCTFTATGLQAPLHEQALVQTTITGMRETECLAELGSAQAKTVGIISVSYSDADKSINGVVDLPTDVVLNNEEQGQQKTFSWNDATLDQARPALGVATYQGLVHEDRSQIIPLYPVDQSQMTTVNANCALVPMNGSEIARRNKRYNNNLSPN